MGNLVLSGTVGSGLRASQSIPDGRSYTENVAYPKLSTSSFSLVDEPSINRDSMLLTMLAVPETDALQVEHFQIEVDLGSGGTKIYDVPHGYDIGAEHYFFGRQDGTPTPCRVRTIYSPKCMMNIVNPNGFTTTPAQTIRGMTSGETADVLMAGDNDGSSPPYDTDGLTHNNNTEYHLILENVSGQFTPGEDIEDVANPGVVLTQVGDWAIFVNQTVVSGMSEEIKIGQKLWVSNTVDPTYGHGGQNSFYVRDVNYISGTTGAGTWKARIEVYAAGGGVQKVSDQLQLLGAYRLGDTLYKCLDNADRDIDLASPIGIIDTETVRPLYDYLHYDNGSRVKQAGPWSDVVNVTCTQGTPSVTVTPTDGQGLISGEMYAPCAQQFEAVARGFSVRNPKYDLDFKNTSGDSWNYANMPSDGRHIWSDFGPQDGLEAQTNYAAGVFTFGFRSAGTHRITTQCWSKAYGDTASGFVDVVVGDSAGVDFTVVTVRPGGGGDYTSLSAAMIDNHSVDGLVRFEIEGGQNHDWWGNSSRLKQFRVVPILGTGTPTINVGGLDLSNEDANTPGEFFCADINFDGGYRASQYAAADGPGGVSFNKCWGARSGLIGCSVEGYKINLAPVAPFPHQSIATANIPASNAGFATTFLVDCSIGNWSDFGMHAGEAGPSGWSGVKFFQNPATMQERGYRSESGHRDVSPTNPPTYGAAHSASVDHGSFRFSRMHGRHTFDRAHFYGHGGWGGGLDGTQECKRTNEGGGMPFSMVYSRCTEEGKPITFEFGTNPGKYQTFGECVVDQYVMISSRQSSVRLATGGIYASNILLIIPDMYSTGSKPHETGIDVGMDRVAGSWSLWHDAAYQRTELNGVTVLDLRSPNKLYASDGDKAGVYTPVNILTETGNSGLSGNTALKDFTLSNLLEHRPNDTDNGVVIPHAPLDMTVRFPLMQDTLQMWDCQQVSFTGGTGWFDNPNQESPTDASVSSAKTYVQLMQFDNPALGTGSGWAMIESRVVAEPDPVEPGVDLVVNDVITLDNSNTFTISAIDVARDGQMTAIAPDTNACPLPVPQAGSSANGHASYVPTLRKDLVGNIRANNTIGCLEGTTS